MRCCRQPPCRREQHRAGRRRAMALFPVDPSWGRWPRLCRALCGRDARAPRKPSSHEIVMPRSQNCGNILAPLVVEGGPCVFVSIRVHWWFIFISDRPFSSNDPHGRLRARLISDGKLPDLGLKVAAVSQRLSAPSVSQSRVKRARIILACHSDSYRHSTVMSGAMARSE